MSEWPYGMELGSIGQWPGKKTVNRKFSQFKASFDKNTLPLLRKELAQLGAKNLVLLIDMSPDQFKINGEPRAQARANSPAVVVSFDSKFGHLSYPCDTYHKWQDNVRAIALSLEALRAVDRHGVTRRGEQYQGFMELEAAPGDFHTITDAQLYLLNVSQLAPDAPATEGWPKIIRVAKRMSHPDTSGGSASVFQRVNDAEAYLREQNAL